MLHSLDFRRALRATAIALGFAALLAPRASAAEAPTPQAIDANAEFLASPSLPAPPVPGKVCVVDTGVDLTTDAAPAVVERFSLHGGTLDDVGGSGIPKHGTFVAGIIASQLDGQGSVGIWPQAHVTSLRVFADATSGTTAGAYIQAMDRCADLGASVVNLSLSGLASATGAELDALGNRVLDLRDNDNINVVAAAGNSAADVGYPGRLAAAFAVGASDQGGAYCGFSARGPEIDITAMGCGVVLSMPGAVQGTGGGTSFAAPIVSGALAALRSYTGCDAYEAEAVLLRSARRTAAGWTIDVAAAFQAAGRGDLTSFTPQPQAGAPHEMSLAPRARSSATPRRPALTDLGVRRPRLRQKSFRRGVLRVTVDGVPDFGRAVFIVDGRRYARPSGKLVVRRRTAPRRISVVTEVPGVGRTIALQVSVQRPWGRS